MKMIFTSILLPIVVFSTMNDNIVDAHQWTIKLAGREAQQIFRNREPPVGWMGADVATSIALTHPITNNTSFVWLFGDTLVGTVSGNGTRSPQTMPRNSIGIMKPTNGKMNDLQYFIRY
jgi:hypothetical protein